MKLLALTSALFAAGLLLSAGAITDGPTVLSAAEHARIEGAQVNFQCIDVQTCDQLNFGWTQCSVGGGGGICLNCWDEDDMLMDQNCVQNQDTTCNDSGQSPGCGEKVLGNCSNLVCSGRVMGLSENCALGPELCTTS